MLLKTGSYTYPELAKILGANNKQGVDRKLERYEVSFTSSGRGNNRIYQITAIKNPFRLYCITELGIPAQADFDKIRDIYYYFFCVDGFTDLPLVEMERIMNADGSSHSRQTISKWIDYLQHLDYINYTQSDCNYYVISRDKQKNRVCKEITKEDYKKAWAIYFEYLNEEGTRLAYARMYNYIGGHPYKKPIYMENAIKQAEIEELINMIIDTLPES